MIYKLCSVSSWHHILVLLFLNAVQVADRQTTYQSYDKNIESVLLCGPWSKPPSLQKYPFYLSGVVQIKTHKDAT